MVTPKTSKSGPGAAKPGNEACVKGFPCEDNHFQTAGQNSQIWRSSCQAWKWSNCKGSPQWNHDYQILKCGFETPNLEIKDFQKEFLMKIITSERLPNSRNLALKPPRLESEICGRISLWKASLPDSWPKNWNRALKLLSLEMKDLWKDLLMRSVISEQLAKISKSWPKADMPEDERFVKRFPYAWKAVFS